MGNKKLDSLTYLLLAFAFGVLLALLVESFLDDSQLKLQAQKEEVTKAITTKCNEHVLAQAQQLMFPKDPKYVCVALGENKRCYKSLSFEKIKK